MINTEDNLLYKKIKSSTEYSKIPKDIRNNSLGYSILDSKIKNEYNSK